MKFFVLIILFSLVFSLSSSAQDTLYAYAESGLVLRAEAHSAGEKLDLIPFGEALVASDEYGEEVLAVELLPAVMPPAEFNGGKSALPYRIHSRYVAVEYKGQRGFVYAGYLCRYPATLGEDANDGELLRWLRASTASADTLVDGDPQHGGRPRMIHFGEDICYRVLDVDGGTGEAVILPAGTLREGYLIANHLYNLEANSRWQQLPDGDEKMTFLLKASDAKLEFHSLNGSTTIEVVAGMLIISWEWSC